MTLDRMPSRTGRFGMHRPDRHLETSRKTPSGTDITSPATAKQLRNSDSGKEICVADLKAGDSKLHTAVAEFEPCRFNRRQCLSAGLRPIRGQTNRSASFERLSLAKFASRKAAPAIACRGSPSQTLQRATASRWLRRYRSPHMSQQLRGWRPGCAPSHRPRSIPAQPLCRSDRAVSDNDRDSLIARYNRDFA